MPQPPLLIPLLSNISLLVEYSEKYSYISKLINKLESKRIFIFSSSHFLQNISDPLLRRPTSTEKKQIVSRW